MRIFMYGFNKCRSSRNAKKPGSFSNDLFPEQIEWEDGYSWCPDKPGLGVEFDIEVAEKSYSEPHGWPAFYERNDGAFTNW